MIIGIGNDITDIRRIEKALARHGERFTKRCFTETERGRADSRNVPAERVASYARRFAAKEAVSKALGCGIDDGVYMKDIGVVNDENGRPSLRLTGGAGKKLKALMPPGHNPVVHLSLSDEPPLAQAFVIIEARV